MVSPSPIVFMHISKTAGSSLFSMLLDGADPKFERSFRGTDALHQAVEHGWAFSAVVAGHFDYTAIQSVAQPHRLVTLLRNPVERALSLYRFSHTITDEEAGRINCEITNFAKASDERTFFLGAPPAVHGNFSNAHARFILGEDWNRLAATQRWDEALTLAKQRLASMAAIAITEDFGRSCSLMFQDLEIPLIHVHEENRLSDRMSKGHAVRKTFQDVEVDVRQFLEDQNGIDIELYRFAVDLVNARIADRERKQGEEPLGAPDQLLQHREQNLVVHRP